MNCRTTQKRNLIVSDYHIEPIIHTKLLHGQTIDSDAGGTIENYYYIILCTHKTTSKCEQIICGRTTAHELLRLANVSQLPVFNPFKTESTFTVNDTINSFNSKTECKKNIPWNPAAQQLHNAISLLIVLWSDRNPDSLLYKLKRTAAKYYYCEPFFERVKYLNDFIRKYYPTETLTSVIEKQRYVNDFKEFRFNLLEEILHLKDKTIQSYF